MYLLLVFGYFVRNPKNVTLKRFKPRRQNRGSLLLNSLPRVTHVISLLSKDKYSCQTISRKSFRFWKYDVDSILPHCLHDNHQRLWGGGGGGGGEDCRAIKQGMVFRYTWVFILKTIQWHIHAGSWSLVNCLAGSPYKALYKVLMNIN